MQERYIINYSCISDKGPWRPCNQDNFLCNKTYNSLFVKVTDYPLKGSLSSLSPAILGVFDGMGGEESGELAALFAAETAAGKELSSDLEHDLYDICMDANKRICAYSQENDRGSMGTTAAMVAFGNDRIGICNIGDSKILVVRNGMVKQVSVDHVCEAPPGRKKPLFQNLGIPETEMKIEPYLAKMKYHDGDTILICSDGLTDMVHTDEIVRYLVERDIVAASQDLVGRALQNGGKDNITVIVAKVTLGG
ncbi:MAG: serine/threonine-protein phosphatase [Clostridiales bacterium]|nr:serine/threonine-protein phosphatase [Clostridiales bacterium]